MPMNITGSGVYGSGRLGDDWVRSDRATLHEHLYRYATEAGVSDST